MKPFGIIIPKRVGSTHLKTHHFVGWFRDTLGHKIHVFCRTIGNIHYKSWKFIDLTGLVNSWDYTLKKLAAHSLKNAWKTIPGNELKRSLPMRFFLRSKFIPREFLSSWIVLSQKRKNLHGFWKPFHNGAGSLPTTGTTPALKLSQTLRTKKWNLTLSSCGIDWQPGGYNFKHHPQVIHGSFQISMRK